MGEDKEREAGKDKEGEVGKDMVWEKDKEEEVGTYGDGEG